ncbi:MAG: acyltransferase 3 [Caulobacteraceae bacterium]|nr:acyltransferase 3 [Caulobacteraceae bacterium]
MRRFASAALQRAVGLWRPLGDTTSGPAPERQNAVGALRLILASMVIFAHCPELLDGDRRREPITMLFHNGQTAGSLAVDGFFLISGYLIAGSWLSDPGTYFFKRVRRIYPAFVICSLLLLIIVGPLGGGAIPHGAEWARMIYRIAILQAPISDGAFAHLHYPAIDASMWTISYEFRCYILAALFGFVGLYRRPTLFLALTLMVLALTFVALPTLSDHASSLIGDPSKTARLTGVFMVGTCFRLLKLPLNGWWAGACAIGLVALLFTKPLAELAFVFLGGYTLFWVALKVTWKPLLTINARYDISYGVYLWAWPISALLIIYWSAIPLIFLLMLTWLLAAVAGALSWYMIERPALAVKIPMFGKPQTT